MCIIVCGVGIGGGFTLRTVDEASLDLITLYTATRSERESRRSAEDRASHSQLIVQASSATGPTAASGQPDVSELQPAIRQLCRTLDGFVYVVDATAPPDHRTCLQLPLPL